MANSPGWIENAADQDPQLGAVDLGDTAPAAAPGSSPARCRPGRACTRSARATRWSRMNTAAATAPSAAAARPLRAGGRRCRRRRDRSARCSGGDRAQVEPAQERHAEAVDQRHRRQQHRVGVRREEPDRRCARRGRSANRIARRHPEVGGDRVRAGRPRPRPSRSAPPPSRRSAAPARRRARVRPTRTGRRPGCGCRRGDGGGGHESVPHVVGRGAVAVVRCSEPTRSAIGRPAVRRAGSAAGRSRSVAAAVVGDRADARAGARRRPRPTGHDRGRASGSSGSTFGCSGRAAWPAARSASARVCRAGCPPSPSPGRPGSARRRWSSLRRSTVDRSKPAILPGMPWKMAIVPSSVAPT